MKKSEADLAIAFPCMEKLGTCRRGRLTDFSTALKKNGRESTIGNLNG
jgi:hypothetical protein